MGMEREGRWVIGGKVLKEVGREIFSRCRLPMETLEHCPLLASGAAAVESILEKSKWYIREVGSKSLTRAEGDILIVVFLWYRKIRDALWTENSRWKFFFKSWR